MKTVYNLPFLFLILFVSITGCEEEELSNQIQILGKWEWAKSQGGFGGWTITPESEGYAKYLEIDNTTYREYINDSLVFQSKYTYRSDTLYGIPEYIDFENGGALGVKVSEYTLELSEFCFDCYVHFYGQK